MNEKLSAEFETLNAHWKTAVEAMSKKDVAGTVDSCMAVISGISKISNSLIQDYAGMFAATRLAGLEDDERTLSMWSKEGYPVEISKDLTGLMKRMHRRISTLEDEFDRNYSRGKWPSFLKTKRARGIAAVVSGVLLIFVVLGAVSGRKGLKAEYFADMELTHHYKTRIDKTVNFDWGYYSPFAGWSLDKFSIRWSGYLRVDREGIYDLIVKSDDGARLWLANELIIDDWTSHAVITNVATVRLRKGYYPLRLDYFDNKKNAVAKLLWKQDIVPVESIIPSKNLSPYLSFVHKGASIYTSLEKIEAQ